MISIRNIVFLLLLLTGSQVVAQSDLMIHGNSPNLHLIHSVEAKETWYSLGRTYNLSPRELASFNNLSLEQPLNIAQGIKVPLTNANFSQNNVKRENEVLVPLYHTVQEKEWMYRISVNHNKVPIESLEKWNNISRDDAKAGTKLIVGFLKVKQGQSTIATAPAERNTPTSAPVIKSDPPLNNGQPQSIPKETPKTETAKEVRTATPSIPVNNPATSGNFKGGYFKTQYDESGKNASGVSGIFRSTSGWNDGRYYALMNSVPTGTIIKVNFPSTNKTIYAKVLGQLPDMKESEGLTIRISDAAASELGAGNSRFTVDVIY